MIDVGLFIIAIGALVIAVIALMFSIKTRIKLEDKFEGLCDVFHFSFEQCATDLHVGILEMKIDSVKRELDKLKDEKGDK